MTQVAGRTVLVCDGGERAALAVVRSLGRTGYRVLVASERARCLAGASRYCAQEVVVPSALRDPVAFADAVATLVTTHDLAAVIPIAEPSLLTLIDHRARLAPAVLPWPDAPITRRLLDKQAVLGAAAQLGIAVPAQVVLASRDDVPALLDAPPALPLVLKPSRSIGEDAQGRQKLSVKHVATHDALAAVLAALPDAAFPLLVQQRIVGPGIGVFALRWQGETVLRAGHERVLEKPPSGGVSVYRRSVVPEPALAAHSDALLAALDWQGVAMIEYKRHHTTGVPYLMEINGRFWGSLQLAVDAGADFPAQLMGRALNVPAPVPGPFRSGLSLRWEWGCIDHLLVRLRRSAHDLALPPDDPGLLRAAGRVLWPWRPGERWEVLRATDPMPFVRESLTWFRGA